MTAAEHRGVRAAHEGIPQFVNSVVPSVTSEYLVLLGAYSLSLGIRNTVSRAFKLGSHFPPSSKEAGEALDLAFLFFRELHDFCPILKSLNERRADHMNRDGVRFCIGQVCRHKKFGYRGIVFQWDHRPVSDAVSAFEGVIGTPRGSNQPFYHILPDFNDAISFFGGVRDVRYVCEDNLEPVEEPYLNRVYSPHASEIFQAPAVFCPEGGVFLPSRQLSYVYPSDLKALESVASYSVDEMLELAQRPTCEGAITSQWVSETLNHVLVQLQQECLWKECEQRGLASEPDSTLSALEEAWGHFPWSFSSLNVGKDITANILQSSIHQSSSSSGDGNNTDWFRNMLPGISPGRAVRNELFRITKEAQEGLMEWNRGYRPASALTGFYNGLQGLLQRRKTSMEDRARVEFQVGDIVRHRSWGYRAVIASFDWRPNLDNMHWDGVSDLKKGAIQPFYTLLPDLQDVKEAFGDPHPTLYIAQESLLRTTGGLVRSPLLKLFFSSYNPSQDRFLPLEGMRFRFPSPSYYTGTTTSQGGLEEDELNQHDHIALMLQRVVSTIQQRLQFCEEEGILVDSLEHLLQGARSKWEADAIDRLQRKLSESMFKGSMQQVNMDIEMLVQRHQYESAILELKELLKSNPDDGLALIHQRLSHLYLNSGYYEGSVESAGYVLNSKPSQRNRIDVLTVRGQAFLKVS